MSEAKRGKRLQGILEQSGGYTRAQRSSVKFEVGRPFKHLEVISKAMKGSKAQSSASHVNNHGRSVPQPTEKVRTKVVLHPAGVSPTRIRKRRGPPPKREQHVRESADESENEENSVVSTVSQLSRSSRGSKVPSERPLDVPAVLSNIPPLKSSLGDRVELVEDHLDSTLRQLDAVRHERNQALELNVELEYKIRTLTDRMETALALAEAAKTDASNSKDKRSFYEKRIAELESAHKTTLDSNVHLQEELVESKLVTTKLMTDLTRASDDKEELEGRIQKLVEEHQRREHKHAEVQAMREKLEALKAAFDAREASEEKEATMLQQFVEKEKQAREVEEKKNEELYAELLAVRRDVESREGQLEDSLSQTLSLHEQVKELKRGLADKADEIQTLKQTQYERDLAHDSAIKDAEKKEAAHGSAILELKKELEEHHVKFSDFMRKEQETQAGLFTQLTESKEAAQRHMVAFHEAEKSIRLLKGQCGEAKSELERADKVREDLQGQLKQRSESLRESIRESKELQDRVAELEQGMGEARRALEGYKERYSSAVGAQDSFKTECASRELAMREESIALREEVNERERALEELREQIRRLEEEHANEVQSLMHTYETSLASKLTEQEHALVKKVKEEAAAVMTEKMKASEQNSDNLVKKHIRIVEHLADMHRSELETLEVQAAQEANAQAESLKRVTAAYEDKVGVLEQELANMKELLEEGRSSKHRVQQQVPLLEESVSALQREVDRLQGVLNDKDKAHAMEVENAVNSLNQQVREYAARIGQGQDEISALKRELDGAREDAMAIEMQLKLDLQTAQDELLATIDDLKAELSDIRTQKNVAETEGSEARAVLESSVRTAREGQQQAETKIVELEALYRTSKEKYEVTARELEHVRHEPAASPQDLVAAEKHVEEVLRSLEQEQEARKRESAHHEGMVQVLQTRISRLESELDETRKSHLSKAEALKDEHFAAHDETRNFLREAEDAKAALLKELANVRKERDEHLREANRLKETSEKAELSLETVREENERELARARQDIASLHSDLRVAREEARECTASVERLQSDNQTALALSKQEYDLLDHKKTQEVRTFTARVEALTRQVGALTRERADLSRDMASLKSDYADKERLYDSTLMELNHKTNELEIATQALTDTRGQVASVRADLVKAFATVASLEHDKETTESALVTCKRDLDKALTAVKVKDEAALDLDVAMQTATHELKQWKARATAATVEKDQAISAGNTAYSKLEEEYRSEVAALKREHHDLMEALRKEHSEASVSKQALHTERIERVEASYEARLRKATSSLEHRLIEAGAAQEEALRRKEEELQALREEHEEDRNKAALALEATKNKLSQELRESTGRLEASLKEKERAYEEDMARLLADHVEAARASDATITKLETQSQRAEAALKAKQSECTQLKGDLEAATTLLTGLQAEHELLSQIHKDHLDRHEEVQADKNKAQSALEALKSDLAQHKRELESQKLVLDDYRRDIDAHRDDLVYHKQMIASHQAELRQRQQEMERQASAHALDVEQRDETHKRTQEEFERIKDREVEKARGALKGSVLALEAQLSEIQRQLQIERETRADNERSHTQEMETARTRYEEARLRHEAAVAEHLQAEELLWKEKECLSRDHEKSTRAATELEERLKEMKMVHASERARSAAEVDIAKQELTSAREQNDKLQQAVDALERKYQGVIDADDEDRNALYEEKAALKSEVRALEHRVSEAAVDLRAKEAKWTRDQQKHVEDTLELRAQHKIALEDSHRRAVAATADAETRYESAMEQLKAAVEERDSMTIRMRAFHESLRQSRDKDFAAMLATAEETSSGLKAAVDTERRKVKDLEDTATEMRILIDAQARKLSENQDAQRQVERLQKQKQELITELQNAIKSIEEHKLRAEQSLESHVTLQLENASLSMDLESVRKQWCEDKEALENEVHLWKEAAAEHKADVVRVCAEEDALKALVDSNKRSLQEHSRHRERLEGLVVKMKEELVVATSTSLLRERELADLRDEAPAVTDGPVHTSPALDEVISSSTVAAAAESTPNNQPTVCSSLTSAPTENVLSTKAATGSPQTGSSPLERVVISSAVKAKRLGIEKSQGKGESNGDGNAKRVAEAIMNAGTPPHRPNLDSYLYDSSGGSTQDGNEERATARLERRVACRGYMPKMLSHTQKLQAESGYFDDLSSEQESD